MAIFDHSEFIPVFLGKIVRKNSEQPFLDIPNLYQSFWEKLSEKICNSYFWPFRIYISLLGKIVRKKIGMAIFASSCEMKHGKSTMYVYISKIVIYLGKDRFILDDVLVRGEQNIEFCVSQQVMETTSHLWVSFVGNFDDCWCPSIKFQHPIR